MFAAEVLAYAAGGVLVLWGVAHIAPTRSVASSFGSLSVDNRRVLVMEWVAEGFTHIFVGLLVILITALEGPFAAGRRSCTGRRPRSSRFSWCGRRSQMLARR
jgi:hypothetical protein